ncbi:DNA/RNA non-specific endonuclease [Leptolyngbya sp. FACHB-17]|uniref:DNA/RNA non-specific endonuclease n=1 Tax=unclassified Leptolyngbya TaxID=2650499 RepID=UPI001680FCED|nr:DNA/RNA non-specific endonuclease [Leptolyngbya sp. FACHB-17]MBD2082528.1 DNA/RNA non-specific endonuclease [Leptolyngbya sp. FACHB-17]
MLKSRWKILTIVALLVVTVVGCAFLLNRPKAPIGSQPLLPPIVGNVHLAMGIPSKATPDIANANDYLIADNTRSYALSYNNSKHIPNWTSWQLNKSWLGTVPRSNDFRPDPILPKGWYQVKSSDYNGSGYDRGHLTPSADRTRNLQTNSATFFMTNILPQTPDNNRDVWEGLESESRRLVNTGKELYIIAGGLGEKGTIGAEKISIPASTWKVIVVMDQPSSKAADVTAKTRVIAVNVPNIQGIKDKTWRDYRISVDQLEAKTGYDFLSAVPEAVQQAIESKVDNQ